MKKRILPLFFALCLAFLSMPVRAVAAETFTYTISASTTTPAIGSEFDVAISLTNYAELDAGIRGLQIDVTNIDPNILEVVSHSSLVDDASAASNETSYQPNKELVRYFYVRFSGTMDKSATDIMRFRLKIKDDLKESGTITLPVVIKIGTETDNITVNDSLTIHYGQSTSDIVSVDVSWGDMEFNYQDGVWDSESHKWTGSGWTPAIDSSNVITVNNTGQTDVKMQLTYTPFSEYGNLTGSFSDETGQTVDTAFSLAAGSGEQVYRFNLFGTTSSRWSDQYQTVGQVTLTILE